MKKILLLTFIAIMLPVFLFAFVGCMKKPDNKADYGPEVALSTIQKAVNEAAPIDALSVLQGQYISIDETQTIDVQDPVTYYQRLDEVTDHKVANNITQLEFKITTKELVNDSWTESTQEKVPIAFENPTISGNSILSNSSQSKSREEKGLSIQSLRVMDAAIEKKVTYHNLIQEAGVMPTPLSVAKQSDCGGLSATTCKNGLRYLKVKFDRVIWDTDDHGSKTSMTFVYSPDIPTYIYSWDDMNGLYFSNQIRTCAQSWVEIDTGNGNKQTVPVQRCAEVRDFQFGHP